MRCAHGVVRLDKGKFNEAFLRANCKTNDILGYFGMFLINTKLQARAQGREGVGGRTH